MRTMVINFTPTRAPALQRFSSYNKAVSFKKAWVLYTVLRLLFFAVPFLGIMLLLPAEQRNGLTWGVVFAAVTAGVIAVALSVLLLSKLRQQAAAGVAHWRAKGHQDEAAAEDELIEAAEAARTAEAAPASGAAAHTAAAAAAQPAAQTAPQLPAQQATQPSSDRV